MKLKFLIVDDNIRNRLLLSEIVNGLDHTSVTAENGEVAINILQNEPVDIVLMDIEMPKMNGFETTQYIRTQFKPPLNRIPVIAITAHNIDEYSKTLTDSGFNEFITKPYSFEKITLMLKQYLPDV